jgi:hypothetical protein
MTIFATIEEVISEENNQRNKIANFNRKKRKFLELNQVVLM